MPAIIAVLIGVVGMMAASGIFAALLLPALGGQPPAARPPAVHVRVWPSDASCGPGSPTTSDLVSQGPGAPTTSAGPNGVTTSVASSGTTSGQATFYKYYPSGTKFEGSLAGLNNRPGQGPVYVEYPAGYTAKGMPEGNF